MTKQCRTCKKLVALLKFRYTPDGPRADCMKCEAIRARNYYTASTGPRAGMGGRKRKYK